MVLLSTFYNSFIQLRNKVAVFHYRQTDSGFFLYIGMIFSNFIDRHFYSLLSAEVLKFCVISHSSAELNAALYLDTRSRK